MVARLRNVRFRQDGLEWYPHAIDAHAARQALVDVATWLGFDVAQYLGALPILRQAIFTRATS